MVASRVGICRQLSFRAIFLIFGATISLRLIFFLRKSVVPNENSKCIADWETLSGPPLNDGMMAINSSPPSAAYMRQWTGSALVQIMACRLIGAKPLSEPMLTYCQLDLWEQTSVKFKSKYKTFHSWNFKWKCRLRSGDHFVQGEMS